jgi:hypothetical protein
MATINTIEAQPNTTDVPTILALGMAGLATTAAYVFEGLGRHNDVKSALIFAAGLWVTSVLLASQSSLNEPQASGSTKATNK